MGWILQLTTNNIDWLKLIADWSKSPASKQIEAFTISVIVFALASFVGTLRQFESIKKDYPPYQKKDFLSDEIITLERLRNQLIRLNICFYGVFNIIIYGIFYVLNQLFGEFGLQTIILSIVTLTLRERLKRVTGSVVRLRQSSQHQTSHPDINECLRSFR